MKFTRFTDLPDPGRPILVLHCEPEDLATALCVGQVLQMRALPLGGSIPCNMLGDQLSTAEAALVARFGCWAYLSDVAIQAARDCAFNRAGPDEIYDLAFEGTAEHVIDGETFDTVVPPVLA